MSGDEWLEKVLAIATGSTPDRSLEIERAREEGLRLGLRHAGYTPGSEDRAVENLRHWIREPR